MPIDLSKVLAERQYEKNGQVRKILKIEKKKVTYEIRMGNPPFDRETVGIEKFAKDVDRRMGDPQPEEEE